MILRLSTCTVDLLTGTVSGDRRARLTPRELQLVRHLADRPGIEVSREELLHDVFGYSPAAVSRAVDKAMASLRGKLEDRTEGPVHFWTTPGGYRFVPVTAVLPVAEGLDSFVGRRAELDALAALIATPGLVTLTGPGGVGKTRLARRAAGTLRDRELVFCELGGTESREAMLRVVARALGVPLGDGDPAAAIGQALAARQPLVILDDVDRLTAHADLVTEWRKLASRATFVLTSRRSTRIRGERIFRTEPLDRASAVELLTVRAAERGVDVAGDESLDAVAARLDDLPLALELAAAWLGVLAPRLLLARFDQRFELLRSQVPDTPARLASLRGALDGSWELLNGPARTVLAQLSVFVGSFGLEAAEEVVDRPADGRPVIEVVAELLDHSLVQRRDGELGFTLLESVRAYAAERLSALGPEPVRAAELAHGALFARWKTRLDAIARDRQLQEQAYRDLDDLVAACRRAVARGDPDLAFDTSQIALRLLVRAGSSATALEVAEGVLGVPGLSVSGRAATSQAAALLQRVNGRAEAARRHAEYALVASQECGRKDIEARVWMEMGLLELDLGRPAAAWPHLEQAMVAARCVGDRRFEVLIGCNLAGASYQLGDLDRAEALTLDALDAARADRDRGGEGKVLCGLGVILLDRRRLDEAERTLLLSLTIGREFGDRYEQALVLMNLGAVAQERGDHPAAIGFLESAEALNCSVGNRRLSIDIAVRLGDSRCEAGRMEHGLQTLERALELALSLEFRLEEGRILGLLGKWEARDGRDTSARERLERGRELLDEPAGRRWLVELLCERVRIEADTGRIVEARATLAEAEGHLARLPQQPEILLIDVAALRKRLDARSSDTR